MRPLTGKVPAEHVHEIAKHPSSSVLARLEAISDLSGTVSDVLDEMGVAGCIGASTLIPRSPGARLIGRALTVRNIRAEGDASELARKRLSNLAEIEGHNQAAAGDVMVIEGIPGASNMGGISASIGRRQGELGAIVDGGVRDVVWQRSIGFPIWSKEVTPVTGKWRAVTVEINGPVNICGTPVNAGDLVVADDTGVCFVPFALVEAVVERAEEIAAGEDQRHAEIEAGVEVPALAQRTYAYQFEIDSV
ncbi:MAG: Demethylmenaquinone methyltransferase-like protein [Acidimicrobiaceae bacterium]|nr:Demethylmenaquinone methyltransferase-like protein [Acidimicrobiaceae bacterium]